VNVWRERVALSLYLSAIAISMAGWLWTLFEGLEWAIGI
jgi:hypothetical protein